MTTGGEVWTGGCLCGAIRYEARVQPEGAGYCHCRICQQASGAPALAFANVPVGHFSYTKGTPALYRSSPDGERRFCATCGTPLEYRDRDGAEVAFHLATLDDPSVLRPEVHIWTRSRIPWFDTADALPRFPRGKAAGMEE